MSRANGSRSSSSKSSSVTENGAQIPIATQYNKLRINNKTIILILSLPLKVPQPTASSSNPSIVSPLCLSVCLLEDVITTSTLRRCCCCSPMMIVIIAMFFFYPSSSTTTSCLGVHGFLFILCAFPFRQPHCLDSAFFSFITLYSYHRRHNIADGSARGAKTWQNHHHHHHNHHYNNDRRLCPALRGFVGAPRKVIALQNSINSGLPQSQQEHQQ